MIIKKKSKEGQGSHRLAPYWGMALTCLLPSAGHATLSNTNGRAGICVRKVDLVRNVFFFSSRRRHTRCLSDWSSDVCSSDLFDSAAERRPRAGGRTADGGI